jgi:hypothetical protein
MSEAVIKVKSSIMMSLLALRGALKFGVDGLLSTGSDRMAFKSVDAIEAAVELFGVGRFERGPFGVGLSGERMR